jgi:hypothetical protein
MITVVVEHGVCREMGLRNCLLRRCLAVGWALAQIQTHRTGDVLHVVAVGPMGVEHLGARLKSRA